LFGIDFSLVFVIAALVIIVLLSAVLIYQIKLIRNISFLKTYAKKSVKEEQNETQNPVLAAVIIAAINQYKNQNSQR
jgi:Na+-transporting methylmalonyl-CoA/oxaloacetate decarboxylase gamma subunit